MVAGQVRACAHPLRELHVACQCSLTIHSSRTRFVPSFKCVVAPLHPLTGQQVAGRLNSGVSRGRKAFLYGVALRSQLLGLWAARYNTRLRQHHVCAARSSGSWSSRVVARTGKFIGLHALRPTKVLALWSASPWLRLFKASPPIGAAAVQFPRAPGFQCMVVAVSLRLFSCGCLTIHSSRTRFFASLKCVAGVIPFHPGPHVAGRLNSSVSRYCGSSSVAASSEATASRGEGSGRYYFGNISWQERHFGRLLGVQFLA